MMLASDEQGICFLLVLKIKVRAWRILLADGVGDLLVPEGDGFVETRNRPPDSVLHCPSSWEETGACRAVSLLEGCMK